MSTISLDFSGIKSYWELHELLKNTFQLPDYYGHNMDALWDCLYCCYDASATIILKNIFDVPKELTPEIEIMLKLFHDLAQKDGVIIRAENGSKDFSNILDYLV